MSVARVDLDDLLAALGLVHLHAGFVADGFELAPVKTSRRRMDGGFALRLVWRRRDAAQKVTRSVKMTRVLYLEDWMA